MAVKIIWQPFLQLNLTNLDLFIPEGELHRSRTQFRLKRVQ